MPEFDEDIFGEGTFPSSVVVAAALGGVLAAALPSRAAWEAGGEGDKG